ncbi:MAG TPA: enoyl-ACP reductase [Armatimonadaceae bacterium]|jgi:enoyl-[acyl-carrier protein] reductase I|nr:enoyl-ACP reductase [Armatimonadaceae bacterium]
MGLLDGKKGIIYGVRNERSIAWGCAQSLAREGATFALTFFGEREEKEVRKLAPTLGEGVVPLIHGCDLTKQEDIDALHEQVRATFGAIDFIVHSVAFAKGLSGRYVDVSADDFNISMLSSAYTYVAAVKAAEPLMPEGGAAVTLTYIGSERVIPNYNTAGVAKAALESSVRYLAHDLGPKGIRVNAISAGATMTLSARGIAGFTDMYRFSGEVAPLRHPTTIDEVGDACAFLVSNLSRGVTGDILFVDSGYHIVGLPSRGES